MKTIIISNRLPIKFIRTPEGLEIKDSEGGLATGLSSVYQTGNNLWLGWPGIVPENEMEEDFIREELLKRNLIPLFLTEEEIDQFYEGFSNKILWPICLYRPSYTVYDKESWYYYQQVNNKFALLAKKHIGKEDTVWVHDYHLMLLPRLLREHNPNVHIGYFQHIPFPSYEIFKLIPWRKELLEGIHGADLIGFHTSNDVSYFRRSSRYILGNNINKKLFKEGEREIKVGAFPMGIDAEKYQKISSERDAKIRAYLIKKHFQNNKLIISMDRLDYSKGIIERIKAIDSLLEKYPEYRQNINFIQLIVPSRVNTPQYQLLKDEIDRLIGKTNAKYATSNWQPIRYFYNSYPIEEICALNRAADVSLVTPIRDGMNLVCKEYIMCNTEESDGVLVLSEMAGAAQSLTEALLVNPNNIDEIVGAIHRALTMSIQEKKERIHVLSEKIKLYDVNFWIEEYLGTLEKIKIRKAQVQNTFIDDDIYDRIVDKYKSSTTRLFLLDYDGTLSGFYKKPEMAKPTLQLLKLLDKIQSIPGNNVAIISGRDHKTMGNWFKNKDYLLYAEHGAWRFLTEYGKWRLQNGLFKDWKDEVRSILNSYVLQIKESFIEEKSFSLVWHYREAEEENIEDIVEELTHKIINLKTFYNHKLKVMEGDKVLEVTSSEIHKGKACNALIDAFAPDFILAIGDDTTDEAMFKALPPYAFSVKVGDKPSIAKYYLKNQPDVIDFLQGLVVPQQETIPISKLGFL